MESQRDNLDPQKSIEQLLRPLRKEFSESGVSDEELVEQITAAQSLYREEQAPGKD
jgi:hypothetical protein